MSPRATLAAVVAILAATVGSADLTAQQLPDIHDALDVVTDPGSSRPTSLLPLTAG